MIPRDPHPASTPTPIDAHLLTSPCGTHFLYAGPRDIEHEKKIKREHVDACPYCADRTPQARRTPSNN